MKMILAALFISLARSNDFGVVDLDKAKQFLNKTPKCTFAVGVPEDAKGKKIESKIFCVSDMTLNKGSLNEFKACAFYEFDLDSGNVDWKWLNGFGVTDFPKTKKLCAEGGFADLMDKPCFLKEINTNKFLTVRDVLAYGAQHSPRVKKPTIFLYGAHPNYEKMWNELKSKAK